MFGFLFFLYFFFQKSTKMGDQKRVYFRDLKVLLFYGVILVILFGGLGMFLVSTSVESVDQAVLPSKDVFTACSQLGHSCTIKGSPLGWFMVRNCSFR